MAQMLVGAFQDQDQANEVVTRLEEAGFDTDDISVVTVDSKREVHTSTAGDDHTVVDHAAGGAVTGAAVGGLAGVLAGAGIVPALAGLLIGGPIAAALGATGIAATAISGAVTGAAAGGLIGALSHLGLSEETAREYDEIVRGGGVILGVPVEEGEEDQVQDIFASNGVDKVEKVTV